MCRLTLFVCSEEFSYPHPSGSFLFSQPAVVDQWCQSIPFGDLPLTPPDTVSDCASSDCPDMPHHGWSRTLSPEEAWTTEHAPSDHSTYIQPYGHYVQPYPNGVPVTCQHAGTSDVTTPWLTVPQGPVDMGLSPVLSQESQSSHTLNSLADPDVSVLPPSLDLSFATEPVWGTSSSNDVVGQYQGHHVQQAPFYGSMPGGYFVPTPMQNTWTTATDHRWTAPQPLPSYPYQPVYGSFVPHVVYPGHGLPYQAVQHRPLLPRTESTSVPSQPVYGPQRVLRPQMPSSHASQSTVRPVSTLPGRIPHVPAQPPFRPQMQTPVDVSSSQSVPPGHSFDMRTTSAPPGHVGTSQARSVPRQDVVTQPRPVGPAGYWSEPAEDWSSFVRFDQTDQQPVSPRSTRMQSDMPVHAPSSIAPIGYGKPLAAKPEPASSIIEPAIPPTGPVDAPTMEGDEGRHRTHPLYNEGPHTDGLYHCPFKTDPSCQHRPTKLKCNYDKFVDSHLKPFRCKIEACSKQEFSSTACLLRHEREAHGMHGHGDRPHLCWYADCERSFPGHGFPRRYNLFDHMKRVHDYPGEVKTLPELPAPETASQSQRRTGRKRKASGSLPCEPALQRVRPEPTAAFQPTQGSHPLAMPRPDCFQPAGNPMVQYPVPSPQPQRREDEHKHQLYSQWANQREVIARQMDFVQSPDDEANLQQLSQNIDELRRLSQEARRG
ncbi:hypothetical protein LTR17_012871 [Elasticomyces elasticus]|nr:hypothetical protein LTR17_012871 [Elasticomyces elasticus]